MATFVQTEPDPFVSSFNANTADAKKQAQPNNPGAKKASGRFNSVRRPVRGIEIKDDTYAVIEVATSSGANIPLIDAAGTDGLTQSSGFSVHYSNFLIQSIKEQRIEKSQIILTFGEPYIFFFGEQPRILQVQGVLMNTVDFNWKAEFLENYNLYLRGTACVQNKTRVNLSWDDVYTQGYIMNVDIDEQSQERNFVQFSFQMFLTNYQNISNIGDPNVLDKSSSVVLDPSKIDALGVGAASFQSSSLAVRQANIASMPTNSGSLLGMLSSGDLLGAISSGTARLNSQVTDLLQQAGDFVAGRNIRVPVGFTGEAAFDADTQLSLSSIDPSSDGTFTLTGSLAGNPFTISATVGSGTAPSTYGPLWMNADEFIARGSPNTSPKFLDVTSQQILRGDDQTAADTVTDTFAAFGIDTDPPSEVTALIGAVGFGIVKYVSTTKLGSVASQAAAKTINSIPGLSL